MQRRAPIRQPFDPHRRPTEQLAQADLGLRHLIRLQKIPIAYRQFQTAAKSLGRGRQQLNRIGALAFYSGLGTFGR